jgi:hypothetical protein
VLLVGVAIASGMALSTTQGVPAELPGPSLGSPLLLHVERALALLGLLAAALIVGVRATRGWFPARFGQFEYRAEELREAGGSVVLHAHEQRLGALETAVEELGTLVRAAAAHQADMIGEGVERGDDFHVP